MFQLDQAFDQGSTLLHQYTDQNILNITKDLLLALKSIHDERDTGKLLGTRVTGRNRNFQILYLM